MDEKKEKQNIPKLLFGFVERINGDPMLHRRLTL